MNINLLDGTFDKSEAINIITKFVDIKIKFQEEKIKNSHNEEDVKMRESRIKKLQKDLYDAREHLSASSKFISLNCFINVP